MRGENECGGTPVALPAEAATWEHERAEKGQKMK